MLAFSVPPGYRRSRPPARPKLDRFTGIIDAILARDEGRPKKQGHTAKRIFARLRDEHGYTGGITIVKDYVRAHRLRYREVFVPLRHDPGHAQVDFAEALAEIAGVERKIHFFAMDLPHSDACFVQAYPAETAEAFCDGHNAAFSFFGKVPVSSLYDNTTLAVARILGDGVRRRTRMFSELQSYYVFADRFGRPGKGNDKGKVEGLIGWIRRNLLVPVPRAASLVALNEQLLESCRRRLGDQPRGHDETIGVRLLLPVVKRLRERFGIAQACIVADRGMISSDTIAALKADKVEYILGARERTSREVRAFIDDDGLAVPLVIPRQKGQTELAVTETTIAGRRYVICRNDEQAKNDAAARAELVAGLERKLAQGDKALVANKGFRRFLKSSQGGGFVIDRAKIEADVRFDGLFVLRTNTKIAVLQVVLRYRNLLVVEDAFKTAKALLATRPIFHKTDAGIRGHVFCTFLALVLRKELLDRLAARRSKLEWQRIIDDLADLSEIEVAQDGRRARRRTAPGPTIDPICRALGLTLPPVFQEMPAAR